MLAVTLSPTGERTRHRNLLAPLLLFPASLVESPVRRSCSSRLCGPVLPQARQLVECHFLPSRGRPQACFPDPRSDSARQLSQELLADNEDCFSLSCAWQSTATPHVSTCRTTLLLSCKGPEKEAALRSRLREQFHSLDTQCYTTTFNYRRACVASRVFFHEILFSEGNVVPSSHGREHKRNTPRTRSKRTQQLFLKSGMEAQHKPTTQKRYHQEHVEPSSLAMNSALENMCDGTFACAVGLQAGGVSSLLRGRTSTWRLPDGKMRFTIPTSQLQ